MGSALVAALLSSFGSDCGVSCETFLPEYDTPANSILASAPVQNPDSVARESDPKEPNFQNTKQLTFGGQNAEAYWNVDGTQLVYQSRQPGYPDEQVFVMNADGSGKRLVSTGYGRCTCSYFSPDGKWIYFSSTHEYDRGAQTPPDMSKGYVWVVNPWFAIYRVPTAGGAPEQVLRRFGYLAETTIAPNNQYMTFTGGFEGDLDIYRSDLDGSNMTRLTEDAGYDGGPFVSWDSKTIAFRRDVVDNEQELADYRALFKENMVRPGKLEIWVMNADGSGKRQLTNLGSASFAPFIHPDGKQVVFSSNYGDPKGREFDLFVIGIDGKNLRRVTHTPEFDGFPMFSRDGKKIVWASNRFGTTRGETNIFVADWKN